MPGAVKGAGDTEVNKQSPAFVAFTFQRSKVMFTAQSPVSQRTLLLVSVFHITAYPEEGEEI